MILQSYVVHQTELTQRSERSEPAIRVSAGDYSKPTENFINEDRSQLYMKLIRFDMVKAPGLEDGSEATALMSEESLSKIWDTEAEDEAWRDL